MEFVGMAYHTDRHAMWLLTKDGKIIEVTNQSNAGGPSDKFAVLVINASLDTSPSI